MKTITATEAKSRFGQIMDQARKEPVVVQSHGRNVAVLLDYDEYKRLEALEDAYWVARAEEAEKSGFVGTDETARWLGSRMKDVEKE
jgi:prevent-host-death family protein